MMKVLIPVMMILSGCAVAISPTIDPKASKNPELLVEDKISCTVLAEEGSWFGANKGLYYSCLEGRGHAVIWPMN